MAKELTDDQKAERRAKAKARRDARKAKKTAIKPAATESPEKKSTSAEEVEQKANVKAAASVAQAVMSKIGGSRKKSEHRFQTLAEDDLAFEIKGFFKYGISWLDKMTGGVPWGRITEIFGWEATGKTALWENTIANCLEQGGLPVIFEPECALEKDRLRGILLSKCALFDHLDMTIEEWHEAYDEDPNIEDPLNHVIYSDADTVELIFEEIEQIIDTTAVTDASAPILIVWDSVATTTAKAELDAEVGEQQYAQQAQIISKELRKMKSKLAKTNTAIIVINQLREQIQKSMARLSSDDYNTFGGRAIRFYATVRINLRKVGKIELTKLKAEDRKKGKQRKIDGLLIEAETIKNKIHGFPPFQKCKYPIMFYEGGITEERSTWELLVEKKKLKSSGSFWKIEGIDDSFYRKDWVEFYREHSEEIQDVVFSLPMGSNESEEQDPDEE